MSVLHKVLSALSTVCMFAALYFSWKGILPLLQKEWKGKNGNVKLLSSTISLILSIVISIILVFGAGAFVDGLFLNGEDQNYFYESGYEDGYYEAADEYEEIGYEDGYESGYEEGYNEGFNDGYYEATGEEY